MTLQVELRTEPEVPLEVDWLSPGNIDSLSLSEISKRTIFHGNREVELGDFFSITGDPKSEHIEWQGDLRDVHWIGKRMSRGRMTIQGSVGRHLGSEMTGGEILVAGDASDWVGAEMKGGTIRVDGDAGHQVGAAYRGSPVGMRRGSIFVLGSCGNELGHSMRRGMIAVGKNAGDLVAFNMLAGSIFVIGDCGNRPGAGMKRGTVGVFGEIENGLLPTFRKGALVDSVIFQMIAKQLKRVDERFESRLRQPLRIHHGDFLEGGRGEILTSA